MTVVVKMKVILPLSFYGGSEKLVRVTASSIYNLTVLCCNKSCILYNRQMTLFTLNCVVF